ncbi:MAG: hypothetical protein CMM50_04620 [Rhodospirillaceae bacterium]|nr:hypothetical protein [Rhodospirillaceae bacterium]|tara:strand:- start:626 stop:1138 length:513 start_codon:yes stop_codon:yes gene_type:complete
MSDRNVGDRVASAVGLVSRRIGELFSLLLFISVVVTVYEVISRYVFNAPTVWAHEITITLSALAFVMSGVYTLQRRDHIRISIVYEMLPARVQRVLDVVNNLVMLVFVGLLTYATYNQAAKSVAIVERTGTASNLPLPPIVKTALAIGAALLFIQGLAHLWQLARRRSDD